MLVSESFKQNKSVDQTEIEIFLSHLLKKERTYIKAFPEFKLNKRQEVAFNDFLKRRSKHEPLHYILGFKEFFNLKFKVDSRVMIPRSETENLVAEVIKHVYSQPKREIRKSITIVDVGTGSGSIAISLAKAIPFAEIIAIDKSSKALQITRENIKQHEVSRQVKLIRGDLLAPIQQKVDIVVANLPYIPLSRLKTLEPEIRKWEPKVALDGGADGFVFLRKIFKQAPKILKPGGYLFYEVDGEPYQKIFESSYPDGGGLSK